MTTLFAAAHLEVVQYLLQQEANKDKGRTSSLMAAHFSQVSAESTYTALLEPKCPICFYVT